MKNKISMFCFFFFCFGRFFCLCLSAGSISITVLLQRHRTTTKQIFTIFHLCEIISISVLRVFRCRRRLLFFASYFSDFSFVCCRSMSVCHRMKNIEINLFFVLNFFFFFIDAAYLFHWLLAIINKSPRERIKQNCNQIVCNWSLIGPTFGSSLIDIFYSQV